jgi:hypothetical protein
LSAPLKVVARNAMSLSAKKILKKTVRKSRSDIEVEIDIIVSVGLILRRLL